MHASDLRASANRQAKLEETLLRAIQGFYDDGADKVRVPVPEASHACLNVVVIMAGIWSALDAPGSERQFADECGETIRCGVRQIREMKEAGTLGWLNWLEPVPPERRH